MGYSGFTLVICGEGGNITYVITVNHVLLKYAENKRVIKHRQN